MKLAYRTDKWLDVVACVGINITAQSVLKLLIYEKQSQYFENYKFSLLMAEQPFKRKSFI